MPTYTTDEIDALRRYAASDNQLVRVEQTVSANGPDAGSRAISVRTLSGLAVRIVPDRGLDIDEFGFEGRQLGWHGPAGRATNFGSPDQEDGLGLLRGFGGFLLTCGYDFFGAPKTGPADHLGYVLRGRQHYPLHGRASFLRAEIEMVRVDWDGTHGPCVVVEGTLRQAALFGEHLENRRRIEIGIATPTLRLVDTVRNAGRTPVPHQMLYHINLGTPLIGPGTRIEGLPDDPAMPAVVLPPLEGAVEAFRFEPRAECADAIGVTNPNGLGLVLSELGPSFSHVGQWWNPYDGMGCVGIEPATASMPPFDDAPYDPSSWLEPGQSERHAFVLTAGHRETG